MIRIEGEILIDRPVDEVFDIVADERNEPRYNSRILRSIRSRQAPSASGPGSRRDDGHGTDGRNRHRVHGLPAPTAAGVVNPHGGRGHQGSAHLRSVATSTRLGWSWELRLRGWYRLLAPVIARSGRRQEQGTWQALKQFLEQYRDAIPQLR